MTWFARFAREIYHVPGTALVGIDVVYVDDSAPATVLHGPKTFAFVRDKSPTDVGNEISAYGQQVYQAIVTASQLSVQFPAASTFIQVPSSALPVVTPTSMHIPVATTFTVSSVINNG